MTAQQFQYLLAGWRSNQLTRKEMEVFLEEMKTGHYRELLGDSFESDLELGLFSSPVKSSLKERTFGQLLQHISIANLPSRSRVVLWRKSWFHYAAVLLLLAGTVAGYWVFRRGSTTQLTERSFAQSAVHPGRAGAILTLADGRNITLDSLGNGIVATERGTAIQLSNGQLAYGASESSATVYNTLTTPNGRQFQVVLPDGSKVWLNASSTLTFPTAFRGNERVVSVGGEAYFEIAADGRRPFRVKAGSAVVDVLGTAFNINAYADEAALRATLVTGSVRVGAGEGAGSPSFILKPAQQAVVGSTIQITGADVDQVIAWKNGIFNFQDKSLREVMRQLARWYDLVVEYEDRVPDIHFVGEMGRDVELSSVLKFLEQSGVNVRMVGSHQLLVLSSPVHK